MHQTAKAKFILAMTLWITTVILGFYRLLVFEATPGREALPSHFGSQKDTILSQTLPTLIMVVHPQCPCTRASLTELARVLARCPGKVRTIVLFAIPPDMPAGQKESDLWSLAAAIPGVEIRRDSGCIVARRLGAETSGQCFLFDISGRKQFSGGITAGRAHEGDNEGSDAIVALLHKEVPQTTHTAVFGCPLETASLKVIL